MMIRECHHNNFKDKNILIDNRITNNPVEGYFRIIKENVLLKQKVVTSELACNLYSELKSKYFKNYHEENNNSFGDFLDPNIKRNLKPKINRETWRKKKTRHSDRGYFFNDLKISHITGNKNDDIEEEEEEIVPDLSDENENQAFLNESIDSEIFESLDFKEYSHEETKLLEANDTLIMKMAEQVCYISNTFQFNQNIFKKGDLSRINIDEMDCNATYFENSFSFYNKRELLVIPEINSFSKEIIEKVN